MNIKSQIIVLVLVVAVGAASLAVMLYMQTQEEIKKTYSLEEKISKVAEERQAVIKDIKEIEKEKAALNGKLKEYSDKLKLVQEDIINNQKIKNSLQKELDDKQQQLIALNEKLNIITEQEKELNAELAKAKEDCQGITEKVDSTRAQKIKLEEDIKASIATPAGVELKKIVVKVSQPVQGQVVDVNTDYNFAIIDLGIKDNIKSGDILGIYRRGDLIAKAVAENIYEDMSSIIILDEYLDVKLLSGDTVKLLKS